jgi:DNA replicative helicase MCM subunit Mcm2 (Cdc46/Mcm family)
MYIDDVSEAVRLMKVATHTAAIDPRTGTIDMDILSTGRSSIDRDLTAQLAQHIYDNVFQSRSQGDRLTVGQIRQLLLAHARSQPQGHNNHNQFVQNLTMSDVEAAVRELQQQGVIQYIEPMQTCILRS